MHLYKQHLHTNLWSSNVHRNQQQTVLTQNADGCRSAAGLGYGRVLGVAPQLEVLLDAGRHQTGDIGDGDPAAVRRRRRRPAGLCRSRRRETSARARHNTGWKLQPVYDIIRPVTGCQPVANRCHLVLTGCQRLKGLTHLNIRFELR